MDLTTVDIPAKKEYSGTDAITVPDGKTLRIETTPGGEEILSVENTSGADWSVSIEVIIKEEV